ncbi:LysM peptidoglycan-binding domain-containing protein [Paraliobacillus sediminis]|uniref:LysM peptidoglycan-binding domain-containing protein n=1 Tax=Paraliobacillus sediminis TaxID=1885916 RepID=UPI000E3D2257|nr:LysM peptidoglycan-binding domain-containing protein [Paraliobacillus sediminis]
MSDYREDQAMRLREQMQQIQRDSTAKEQPITTPEKLEEDEPNIDILDLPPRSYVHADKKTKTKWKINFLFIRFLVVLFIVIVGLVLTYQVWGEEWFRSINDENTVYSLPVGEKVTVIPINQELSNEVTIAVAKETNENELVEVTGRYYLVTESDTLILIAEKYYQSTNVVSSLREFNELDSNIVTPGQKIFLPNEKELKILE